MDLRTNQWCRSMLDALELPEHRDLAWKQLPRIVEQYQGKISVRSERGKFCEFTLDFPENEELPQAVNQ